MEDLQFRDRRPEPQDGMHFQWMIGLVIAMFGVGTYLFVLTVLQHRLPIPRNPELVALSYATPFVIGGALASANAISLACGKRVAAWVRTLPVFALVLGIAWSVASTRVNLFGH